MCHPSRVVSERSSILVAAAPAAFACALLLTPAPARAETLITAVVLSDGSQPGSWVRAR